MSYDEYRMVINVCILRERSIIIYVRFGVVEADLLNLPLNH
jgi:hypothetical protein